MQKFSIKEEIIKTKTDKMKELDIFKDETTNVIENPSDCGNCQFASVAHQLFQFGVFRST